jgi:3-oxoacyl-[acyl-carrier-protein] synthase II
VDHVNTHGTATIQNDRMESRAIRRLLGERTGSVPITSIKSMIGHTTGASGALEGIATLLSIRHGFVPPVVGCDQIDEECPVDVVHGEARRVPIGLALSNSFAFGGNDASLVLARWRTA